ncbi:MAG: tyrosine-protein phosphatase [Phycisphaerales bacterium]|nr:tyrosine-protein phosphatase [Phycisphaerales bacterium]
MQDATTPKRGGLGSVVSLALVAALAVGVGVFGYRVVWPDLHPKRFAEVVPGKVYRSAEPSPAALESMVKERGIRTIIDLGVAPEGDVRDRRLQLSAQALGVTRFKFDLIGDSTGNPNEYVAALRIASDPARQPVLVHCATGSQRTSCAIGLFRAAFEGVSVDEAIAEAKRFDAKPKVDETMRSIASPVLKALREGGWIEGQAVPRVEPTTPIAARP